MFQFCRYYTKVEREYLGISGRNYGLIVELDTQGENYLSSFDDTPGFYVRFLINLKLHTLITCNLNTLI